MNIPPTQLSSYLDDLPAIFRQAAEGETLFLRRFLLAFEKILTGLGDPEAPGLEEILGGIPDPFSATPRLAGIQRYFDPGPRLSDSQRAPADFLPWLASWVALTLRADWTDDEKRRFISRIVPLYRLRGTKNGLAEMLSTYTKLKVIIYEFENIPHYFQVYMYLGTRDPALTRQKELIAQAIIEQEKPAHTFYKLKIDVLTLQIGKRPPPLDQVKHSQVGKDTLLGTRPP